MPYIHVDSPNVTYTDNEVVAKYTYETTLVDGNRAVPMSTEFTFKTDLCVPRVGVLLVGWGGNNGSTVTAALYANKHGLSWKTRQGTQTANYYGSIMLASTVKLGTDLSRRDIYVPFNQLLPTTHPNDFVIGGWDINNANLAEALDRAAVLEPDLKRQLQHYMSDLVPMPSAYYPDFIAANQGDRANNVLSGTKSDHLARIRDDIRRFKAVNGVGKVIIVWTANTERYATVIAGVNDTSSNLLRAIECGHSEIAPSTIFAVAAILEGAPYINGSPQNTFVPGLVELAEKHRVFIGGDDFKSGQTKIKSVLVEFMVDAGLKPLSIASYNHLGNNDGKNLSAPAQFRSKEISKSSVVDDMVAANSILYQEDEHPDHIIVIKYVPSVGDSKRALDEYVCEIFMGGRNVIAMHNTCEDSLLAAPLILDLVILTELMTRVRYKTADMSDFDTFHSVLSLLSYLLKAPMVPQGTPVVNGLKRQRNALENVLRALIGLRPQSDMLLEAKAFH